MSDAKKSAGAIFDAVVEAPQDQRAAFLDKACAGNEDGRENAVTKTRPFNYATI